MCEPATREKVVRRRQEGEVGVQEGGSGVSGQYANA